MLIKLTINSFQNKEKDYLLPRHMSTFTLPAPERNFQQLLKAVLILLAVIKESEI